MEAQLTDSLRYYLLFNYSKKQLISMLSLIEQDKDVELLKSCNMYVQMKCECTHRPRFINKLRTRFSNAVKLALGV